jgi:hypothetical protein
METKKTGAAPAAKVTIEKSLKDSAKITVSICGVIEKKILGHKTANLPDPVEVAGANKADIMKLVEMLDSMGSTTYKTACALRELYNKMKD